MSDKSNFTADEWQLLLDVPLMVGAAVMVVGKSGLGTLKESFALAQQTLGAMTNYPDNALIQAIVEARFKDKEKASIERFSNPMLRLQPEEFKIAVVEKCVAANSLLAAKADAAESAGYKQWVQQIGEAVANAATEGGVFGFGGTRFSENEQIAMREINNAFGIA